LETLAQDSDADVRRVAITALGDSGGGNKELALKLSDVDPAVRCAALDALAKNPPQEVSSAIQRASMDESSKVRASLAK
jgi:HEAT repeat protein